MQAEMALELAQHPGTRKPIHSFTPFSALFLSTQKHLAMPE